MAPSKSGQKGEVRRRRSSSALQRARSLDDLLGDVDVRKPQFSLLASERCFNTSDADVKMPTKREGDRSSTSKRGDSRGNGNQSDDSGDSGTEGYRGLVNLCILLLVLTNFRMVMSNLYKV